MANVRRGNIHYVDSTGVLTTNTVDRVAGIVLSSTAGNASITLQTDSGDNQNLMTLKEPTNATTAFFDFSSIPLFYGLKGLQVSAITNCVCTIIYSQTSHGVKD